MLSLHISRYPRTNKAFTLVELLVVIAVMAILAVIVVAIFSAIPAKARDAKRKANVDAIAKALEVKYNAETGIYSDVNSADFAKAGADALADSSITKAIAADGKSFTVCATLETTTTPFCVNAAMGNGAAVVAQQPTPTPAGSGVACARFNNLTVGQSQTCVFRGWGGNPPATVYIKCSDIPANINCSDPASCTAADQFPFGIPLYAAATSATPISATWTQGYRSPACSGGLPIRTVYLRN